MDTKKLTLDELIQHYKDECDEYNKHLNNIYFYDEDASTEHFSEKVEKYTRQTPIYNSEER